MIRFIKQLSFSVLLISVLASSNNGDEQKAGSSGSNKDLATTTTGSDSKDPATTDNLKNGPEKVGVADTDDDSSEGRCKGCFSWCR